MFRDNPGWNELALVTLILGMSKDEGIYLSVDYRVTDARTGALVDDQSVKHLQVTYPPDQTGPKALMAYTGLARLRDRTPVGEWMRTTLRGESEVFDGSMAHLRSRLDRDLAPLGHPLIVNALVVQGQRRFFGGLSNIELVPDGQPRLRHSFGYSMQELTKPFVFANGSGAQSVVADGHLQVVSQQLDIRPRRVVDHMKLLSTVNRRVALRDTSVSPYCHVSFVNADDRYSPTSRVFTERGESVPFEMPIILFGVDVSFMAKQAQETFRAMRAGEDGPDWDDADEMNKHLRRRP